MLSLANTVTTSLGDYNNRTVSIEITGLCHKGMRSSNYTVKVPYRRLSQEMQRLMRMGGKITSVKLLSFSLKETESAQIPALPMEKVPLAVESLTTAQVQNADIIKTKPLQRSKNQSAAKKNTRTIKTRRRRTIKGKTKV